MQIVCDEDNEQEEPSKSESGLKIPGLDIDEGIKNCGSKEFLLELIGDFWMMIDSKSSKIKELFDKGNIRDYTIEVHALKNNARMIGATELSELFYQMEKFGNEEKVDEIKLKLPRLLELYRSYIDLLAEYVKRPDETEKIVVTNEQIKETLQKIHDAVDQFDLDSADEAMRELDNFDLPDEIKSMVEQLKLYVTDVALEDIMELTQKIKETIN